MLIVSDTSPLRYLVEVDERLATAIAQEYGVKTAGTLGVLRDAGHAGLIDFHLAIHGLTTQTTFHHTKRLIAALIAAFEAEQHRK